MTHEPLVTITLAEYNRLIGTSFSAPTVIGTTGYNAEVNITHSTGINPYIPGHNITTTLL